MSDERNKSNYFALLDQFPIEGTITDISPIGNGHINDTLGVRVRTLEGKEELKYVLQKINHLVFNDVETLQNNVFAVTEHIRKKLSAQGDTDLDRHTLTFIPTKTGDKYFVSNGSYWRLMKFIDNSISYESVTPALAREAGAAFGQFQALLSDLPEGSIGETIPRFHDMSFRLEELKEAVQKDPKGRAKEEKVKYLLQEIDRRTPQMLRHETLFRDGKLPLRTNHLDTKVNNVLFDKETGKVLTVIDLDTVMPGFVTSDIGDFIRTAVNTGAEDETDLAKISVDMEIFKSYTEGYLSTAKSFLTPTEIELLPYGGRLLTYMQTVRFLTDYINGDVYYKINQEQHNLIRATAQFEFLLRLEEKQEEMDTFVRQYL